MNLQRGRRRRRSLEFGPRAEDGGSTGVFGASEWVCERLEGGRGWREGSMGGVLSARRCQCRVLWNRSHISRGRQPRGAEFIIERQIAKPFRRQRGRFVATRVAGVAVAGAVPVVGWVLLGMGIAASVGAALMEPPNSKLGARQTPFGKGPDGQKFQDLDEQNNALNKVLNVAAQAPAAEAKSA